MENQKSNTAGSKLLSFVLRHDPAAAGITLAPGGWVDVETLLEGLSSMGHPMTRTALEHIVDTDEKKRFTFSDDRTRIRAAQGHSVTVEMEYIAAAPPEFLYHGTASKYQSTIEDEGLKPMSRQFVHLSMDTETARNVGKRHGKPIIFEVATGDMHAAGHEFYQADNGVWLAASVPPEFLRLK